MESKSSVHNNKVLILVAVCFIFFVIVGILLIHNGHKSAKDDIGITTIIGHLLFPSNNVMVLKRMRSCCSFYHQHSFNSIKYVSKRRIPGGPDPYHNRDIWH
ncbi:unnamed protein product [Cuscuta epithymum]|uniref:Uncharacterized protein n=1 Tax=Cuscuta epithymum TaxID=186058 RepID=A0AAV0ETK0_9ASTE|nr:unnamed protein product [Cuscuta epithymum]